MAPKLATILILILFALAFGEGCSAPAGGGGQPQAPGQTGGEIYPGPVVTVPPIYFVDVQVNRNPISTDPYITVTFRGGKGQYILKKILGVVVRSDGQVITKEIDQPEGSQIAVGESMTFTGTTGVDRVIVMVTILGKDYKIYDQNLDFNAHP